MALAAADARNAAAAASGKGFGRTLKTSGKGAPTPDTTSTDLKPEFNLTGTLGG